MDCSPPKTRSEGNWNKKIEVIFLFKIKKLGKWHKKATKVIHCNVHSSERVYNELEHHIWLRESPQKRLTPYFDPKP